MHARLEQLGADDDRERRADQAGADGENEIEGPDVLVVGGIQEPPPSGREVVLVMSLNIVMAEVGDGRHI